MNGRDIPEREVHVIVRTLPSGQVVIDDEMDTLTHEDAVSIAYMLVPRAAFSFVDAPGGDSGRLRGTRYVFE